MRAMLEWQKLRAQRAALIGLTYDEYVLEILERGRYLGSADTRHSSVALMAFSPKFAPPERICLRPGSKIAQIVAKRGVMY